jgi:hypothetical protein
VNEQEMPQPLSAEAVEEPVDNIVPEKIARLPVRWSGDMHALANGARIEIGNAALPDKAIINGVKLVSVCSDVDCPVDLSLGLFENTEGAPVGPNQLSVENKHGWITSDNAVPSEFATLVSLHPCETGRYSDNSVYTPASALSNRYIQQYGHLSPAKLRESIVSLPGEEFYLVDSKSTISQIVQSNWEALGLSVPSEVTLGSYIRVARPVIDHVVQELQDTVLSRIPFSNLSSMKAHLTAGNDALRQLDEDCLYNIRAEFQVQYEVPAPASQEIDSVD